MDLYPPLMFELISPTVLRAGTGWYETRAFLALRRLGQWIGSRSRLDPAGKIVLQSVIAWSSGACAAGYRPALKYWIVEKVEMKREKRSYLTSVVNVTQLFSSMAQSYPHFYLVLFLGKTNTDKKLTSFCIVFLMFKLSFLRLASNISM